MAKKCKGNEHVWLKWELHWDPKKGKIWMRWCVECDAGEKSLSAPLPEEKAGIDIIQWLEAQMRDKKEVRHD